MTEKNRPRGKPYKEWNEKDAEENDSNINWINPNIICDICTFAA